LGGKPGPDSWKLFEWTGTDWILAIKVTPGKGYWLQQRVKPTSSFTTGSGQSADITGVTLDIQPGWNLMGSPYLFPINVDLDSSIFSGPWMYGGFAGEGWVGGISQLQPWGGYGLYNWTESVQTIRLRPLNQQGNLAKQTAVQTDGWTLRLMATGKTYSDKTNFIGQRNQASDDWDFHDQPEPPYIDGYVSLSMAHPEWGRRITEFSSDIRSTTEEINVWNVDLKVKGEEGLISLSGQLFGELPEGNEIWLLDLSARKSYNLLENREISTTVYSYQISSHYKIISGPSNQIKRTIENICTQIPSDFSLF
jgi:hypothetical protein